MGSPSSIREPSPSRPSPARRKSCPFGAACYRRNPVHKADEAHPGDTDYRSDAEEEEDDEVSLELELLH